MFLMWSHALWSYSTMVSIALKVQTNLYKTSPIFPFCATVIRRTVTKMQSIVYAYPAGRKMKNPLCNFIVI